MQGLKTSLSKNWHSLLVTKSPESLQMWEPFASPFLNALQVDVGYHDSPYYAVLDISNQTSCLPFFVPLVHIFFPRPHLFFHLSHEFSTDYLDL